MRLIGINFDVTEVKIAEKRLRDSKDRLRRILSNAPIPIICASKTKNPKPNFINSAFVDTFGYMLEDLTDLKQWVARACPDPQNRSHVLKLWDRGLRDAALEQGRMEPMETLILCKDDSQRNTLLSVTILPDLLVVVLQDITRRKKALASLGISQKKEIESQKRQRKELRKKLKTSLTAAAIAHEINQPPFHP